MTDPVASLLRRIEKLEDGDVLKLHREVCRRAAAIYAPMYQAQRDHNYALAMRIRDTRFQAGLSPRENVMRMHRYGPGDAVA